MANNYTAVPHAYIEEFEPLTDEEFGRLLRALLRYSRDGTAIEPVGNERFYVRRVMTQEDVMREKYAELCERRREAGRLGAAARWQKWLAAEEPFESDGKPAEQNRTG